MADPGFVSGLIGAAIAEMLARCIKAAEQSLAWEGHCDYLRILLEQLLPFVEAITRKTEADEQDISHDSLARNVHSSIDELRSILCEAEDVLNQCANPDIKWNPVKRYKASVMLQKTANRVKDFMKIRMPVINNATIHYNSEMLLQRLQEIPDQVKDTIRRERYASTIMSLGLQTQNRLLSCADFNKERAFAMIKDGADQLLHFSSEMITGETSSTRANSDSIGLDDQVEDQPLPKFVFGMDSLNSRLQELLLDPDENGCKWIGIWAKGGAGKTLLVQNAMNSLLIRAHFDYKVYMVQLGSTVNVLQVQSKLARKIEPSWPWNAKAPDEGKTELFNILKRKLPNRGKCLIILDDVWDADILRWFDVLNDNNGSRIALTTRNQDVVLRVHATELTVGMLCEEDSTKLFCVHAFGKEDVDQVQYTHPLCGVVKSIVKECGGLPLALKVVGGALAATPIDRPDEWELALCKIREAIGLGKSHEEQLYCRLKLSYDYLGRIDVSTTSGRMYKECFLYFAAYPEDRAIQTQDLVNLWIAEGLIKSTSSEEAYSAFGLDPETEAYSVLGILIGRSLVELESKEWSFEHNTTLLTCKIHDVLRDVAMHIIQRDNAESWERSNLFKAGWSLPATISGAGRKLELDTIIPPRQKPLKELLQKTRKLSLVESSIASLPTSKVTGAPPLEVLLLENNPKLTKIPHAFLGSFVKLTVLELSRTGITTLPSSLGELRNLALLSLHHNGSLQSLPVSLGRLTSLRHLDLNFCGNLTSLPAKALRKLVNLTYLNTRGCGAIWEERAVCRSGICCMTGRKHTVEPMETLAALTQLRKLWIGSVNRRSIPGEAIGKLLCLKYVSLYFPSLPAVPDEMEALVNLETLDLNMCSKLEKLPVWVGERMRSLMYLDLRVCSRITQLHHNLNQLTNLKKLELSSCSALAELPASLFSDINCFPLLEELWLQGCRSLKSFPEVAEGALRRLATVNVSYCDSLATLPDSFAHLGAKLQHLDMGSCKALDMDYITSHQLSAFVCLQDLILKNNPHLTILPLSVVSLPKLAKLDVSGCPNLMQLPEAHDFQHVPISYFPSLQELVAAKSGLEDIPLSIIDIPNLKLLDVKDCDKLILHVAASSSPEPPWRARARSRAGQLVVHG